MGWNCPSCHAPNANDTQASCDSCQTIRVRHCANCKGEIKYGKRVHVNGQAYHPDCLRCAACHKAFPTNKFQVKDGQFFHPECNKPKPKPKQAVTKVLPNDGKGWKCSACAFFNADATAPSCGSCNAIHVVQCPTCKGEIKFGKRIHVNGKAYHPECFRCAACNEPFPKNSFQIKDGKFLHPECNKPTTVTRTVTHSKPKAQAQAETQPETKMQTQPEAEPGNDCGWNCPLCSSHNDNPAQPTCGACNAIRVLQCPTCKKEIKYGQRLNVHGKVYHPDCFCCAACHETFPTNKFQVKDGEFYHYECYKQLFNPRCDVCEDFIPYVPGTERISFKVMPFWNLRYCPSHDENDRCCSCQRVEPTVAGREFQHLSDGRKICHDCCKFVVLDSQEAQGVVKEVWSYMQSIGIRLPDIPVYLVEAPELNEQCYAHSKTDTLMKGNKPTRGHVTRGLCLSEVSQVRTMTRNGKNAVPQVTSIQKNRSVNAVLILHGLPSDLTASVLAHEATHAYIKLSDNFPDKIPMKIEEGICQLMSYLWVKYKHETTKAKKNSFEARLLQFYMDQIENDVSPVYGDGFREAYEAYQRTNSLKTMFDAIRRRAAFP